MNRLLLMTIQRDCAIAEARAAIARNKELEEKIESLEEQIRALYAEIYEIDDLS